MPCFPEKREWEQEKVRYYVELPADAWDDGSLLQLIKDHQPLRPLSLEAKRANLLMDHEVCSVAGSLSGNSGWRMRCWLGGACAVIGCPCVAEGVGPSWLPALASWTRMIACT